MTSTSHFHSTGSLAYFSTTPTTSKKSPQHKDHPSKSSSKAAPSAQTKDHKLSLGDYASLSGSTEDVPSVPQSTEPASSKSSKLSFFKSLFKKA